MTSAPGTPVERYGGGASGLLYVHASSSLFATPASRRALTIQVAWARATLHCPAVQSFVATYDVPMTVSRFVSNLVQSPSNSLLRIDPDPEHAYHQECGPGTPADVREALKVP